MTSAACSKRTLIQPSRNCDYVSELALQPCDSLTLDESLPIGTAMLVWGLQYKECKLKHEILRACIEADRPKLK